VYHKLGFALRNTTDIDTLSLMRLFGDAMRGWPLRGLRVWVRNSRGAAFSGTCFDRDNRIYINLSPRLSYPYALATDIAPAITCRGGWYKPAYTIELTGACQLALFVFLHECYHRLVRQAGRNPRYKESMCDRFAARILIRRFGCTIRDDTGRRIDRGAWDIDDVDGFVRAALHSA